MCGKTFEDSEEIFPGFRKGPFQERISEAAHGGEGREESKALLSDAGSLCHRHPGQRAAVYHGGSSLEGECKGDAEGQSADRAAADTPAEDTEGIYENMRDSEGEPVSDKEWEDGEPERYLAGDESAV